MIEVYDNIFDYNYSNYVWDFVKNSRYSLGWLNDDVPEHASYVMLHSLFNPEEVNRLGIIEALRGSDASSNISDKKEMKTVVNLAIPGQTFFEHTHHNNWKIDGVRQAPSVCLYYPNREWRRQWGGETIFYDSTNQDIERAVEYRPNRLVFFTGEHSHSVRPPTSHAPFFRFTISMFFTDALL